MKSIGIELSSVNFLKLKTNVIKKISSRYKALYYFSGYIKSLSIYKNKIFKPKKNKALIKEINGVLFNKKNIYIHQWKKNDLVIWDNYQILHCPVNNFKNKRRAMLRISVQ